MNRAKSILFVLGSNIVIGMIVAGILFGLTHVVDAMTDLNKTIITATVLGLFVYNTVKDLWRIL